MGSCFDYIVVGAGSAGCPVAARLSEDPSNRVLLIEAGPRDRSPWLHIPIGYYRSITSPYSWGYSTEPEPSIGGRRILWPRGKVLGGSSAINGLVYIRGQKQDYDRWAELGNTGWSFDDVLPFFRKAENQQRGSDDYHGVNGPLSVSDIPDQREICDTFVAAAQEAGIPFNSDFNGTLQEGVGYYQTTAGHGRRYSASVSYLKPIRNRPNLRIQTNALVRKILFDGKRAKAISIIEDCQQKTISANKEIVIAGGTINTPQILQLSGIGPGKQLQQQGIEVIEDVPGVGQNLQDHYQARVVYQLNKPISVNDEINNLYRRLKAGFSYLLFRRGPMTFSAGFVGVFTRVLEESTTPDVQIHFIPFSATGLGGKLHAYSGVTVSVCQLRPESRGEIMIRSSDPFEHPRISPNYLDTEYDRRLIIEGLKLVRRVAHCPAFAQHLQSEQIPGDSYTSDGELLDFARNNGSTIFHPTSTCKMGIDKGAVVDPRLRVRGIEGLRIADCSIMPSLVSGNTNAPAIMIGEKCAHMMLEDSR